MDTGHANTMLSNEGIQSTAIVGEKKPYKALMVNVMVKALKSYAKKKPKCNGMGWQIQRLSYWHHEHAKDEYFLFEEMDTFALCCAILSIDPTSCRAELVKNKDNLGVLIKKFESMIEVETIQERRRYE